MKRFVTYIYQYDQGKRGKNAGFIKVDMRESGCRMELQVRMQERVQGRGQVYLIISGEPASAVLADEMAVGTGGGRMKLFFNRNLLGDSGYRADQIQAVAVRCGGKLLISSWTDDVPETVLRGTFNVWEDTADTGAKGEGIEQPTEGPEPQPQETKSERKSEMAELPSPKTEDAAEGELAEQQEPETEQTEENRWMDQAEDGGEPQRERASMLFEDGAIHTGPEAVQQENHVDDRRWGERMPEELAVPREEVSDMEGGLRAEAMEILKEEKPRITYQKIEITEIRQLPKSNWHLCSNSFLIHGFFNYRYLMLKTVEENGEKKIWLGVPGIYEQPERMMALMFGFSEFEPARQDQEATRAAVGSGKSGVGVYGYWMCRLTN